MFLSPLFIIARKIVMGLYRCTKSIINNKKVSNLFFSILNFFKKIKLVEMLKNFGHGYFSTEKYKMVVSSACAIVLAFVFIFVGSLSKTAIYINGEKIGYAENQEDAVELVSEYNDFAETNHGSSDIVLQNELSLSQNLLNANAIQQAVDITKEEEFVNAYLLYIDDVLVTASDNSIVLKNTISKLEKDIAALLGYNASIYNNIEIKNSFYPINEITNEEALYETICGFANIKKENISKSTILDKDSNPIKLYSVNGILFELYEYYEVEREVKSTVVEKKSDELFEGSQKLVSVGKNGKVTDIYKKTIFEGKTEATELIDTEVVTEKVDTVILTGTKKIDWENNPKVLMFPMTTKEYYVSSEFGMRDLYDNGNWRLHGGIDFAVGVGHSIVAADSGVVTVSEYSGGGGNWIEIKHDNGLTTQYLHMSQRLVSVGERVYAGQQIGLSGNTGYSTGPHLHFVVRDRNNEPVNPRIYTQGIPD